MRIGQVLKDDSSFGKKNWTMHRDASNDIEKHFLGAEQTRMQDSR